ncbi:hypothetical protein [Nocardia sp. NPDC004604]|uniref:hypothetical protein n=1 Tax=Nocardia sp. NPDC004604 TaxID=3157013 RepID=UPI0033B5B13F
MATDSTVPIDQPARFAIGTSSRALSVGASWHATSWSRLIREPRGESVRDIIGSVTGSADLAVEIGVRAVVSVAFQLFYEP